MQTVELAEKAILKKYRRTVWLRFIEAVREYELIKPGDKVAVCISGGKDSMLMGKCVQLLARHSDFPFEPVYLVMDPGYSEENFSLVRDNAEALGLPIQIFHTNIYDVAAGADRSQCYLCAKMRRGALYNEAQRRGCNKIALGHHFDDVVETVLLSILYGAEFRTMMPKLHSQNFPGMELIRPLYHVREADIIAWRQYLGLDFIQCACRFTESCVIGDAGGGGKRHRVKQLIKEFRKENPNIDQNIFTSAKNVDLSAVIAYRAGGVRHSFLEEYDAPPEPKGSEADDEI